jgi:hypothetical protein
MPPRSVLVCTHGHCFDGMASAALFTKLRVAIGGAAGASYTYKSCGYGPGMSQIPASWLKSDENAILDFRFTESPKVEWYFDHHPTAFADDAERDRALAGAAKGGKLFWDPGYGSCAKLIADVARDRFAEPLASMADLVAWADRIDAARFASAEEATSVAEPAMRLAAIVEQHGNGAFLETMVPRLLERSLADIAAMPDVEDLWKPIAASRAAFEVSLRAHAVVKGNVVVVDLGDKVIGAAPKFVTYAAFPQCTYSVTIARTQKLVKVGVGYNPWGSEPRLHDIAAICKRAGGGGHPVVGAVSFPTTDVARARELAASIARELAGPPA